MLNIGPQELILILIVALVVVGPQRLPELGRTIGKALREFRKIQDDVKDTIKFDLNDEPEPYVRPKKTPTPAASSASGNGSSAAEDVASAEGDEAPVPAKALPDANGSVELPTIDPAADASPSAETDTDPRAREPRATE
jgi:Tat protein translocase TatB subunit